MAYYPQAEFFEVDRSQYFTGPGGLSIGIVGAARKGEVGSIISVSNVNDLIEKLGPPLGNAWHAARAFLTQGSIVRFVRVSDGTEASASVTASVTGGTGPTFTASSPGTWANMQLRLEMKNASSGSSKRRLEVWLDGYMVEEYDEVDKDSDADWATKVSNSSYITATNGTSGGDVSAPQTLTPSGGADGTSSLTPSDYIGSTGATKTGLRILEPQGSADIGFLLCPDNTALHKDVWNQMVSIAESRGDVIALLDPPDNLTPTQVVDWSNGTLSGSKNPTSKINTDRAAAFYPWVKTYDPYNNTSVWIPPSGPVAAVHAKNDEQNELWYAAAGKTNGNLYPLITDVRCVPTPGELGYMCSDATDNAVNPIMMKGGDLYILHQKTLLRNGTSPMTRISVRRMLDYIESRVARVAREVHYDPLDEIAMDKLERLTEPIFRYVKSRRGLNAYNIVCDTSVNLPATLDQSQLIAYFYLIPTLPAEKIQIKAIITAQGVEFSEITGTL